MEHRWLVVLSVMLSLVGCDDASPPGDDLLPRSEVQGEITQDTTWRAADCPVSVTGDLYVQGPSSPTLTIEAGCEVRFGNGFGLYVGYSTSPGSLRVNGTALAPVRFVGTRSGAGSWAGLGLWDQTVDDETVIDYLVVEDGGGNFLPGAITFDDASARMNNVTITNSGEDGLVLRGESALAAGSQNIVATGNTGFGARVTPNAALTLPPSPSDFSINGSGAVAVEAGDFTNTGTLASYSYTFFGDVYVQRAGAGAVLTIAPGARLAFGNGYGLYVAYSGNPGGLVAEGTAANPIVFTGQSPSRGAWAGVAFYNATLDASARIAHVRIEYAGGNFLSEALRVDEAVVSLQNATITDSQENGIGLFGAGTLAANSTALQIINNGEFGVSTTVNGASSLPSAGSSYAGNTAGGVELKAGDVTGTRTWRALDANYVAVGDVYVQGPGGAVLTIEAGATIAFGTGYGLYVGYNGNSGALVAVGTPTNRITFTGVTPSAGAWSGIGFWPATNDAATQIDHVVVEYAGGNFLEGAVVAQDASVDLNTTEIRNSSEHGVVCSGGGSLVLTNVTFSGNVNSDVLGCL